VHDPVQHAFVHDGGDPELARRSTTSCWRLARISMNCSISFSVAAG
jgi:hypothetical protein